MKKYIAIILVLVCSLNVQAGPGHGRVATKGKAAKVVKAKPSNSTLSKIIHFKNVKSGKAAKSPKGNWIKFSGGMAKLADATDLKSVGT